MANFVNSSFKTLTYNITSGAANQVVRTGNNYIGNLLYGYGNSSLFYSKSAFKNRIIQALRVSAKQIASATIQDAYPAYKRYIEKKNIKKAIEKNTQNLIQIIDKQSDATSVKADNGYKLDLGDGNYMIAQNKYGTIIKDPLILAAPTERSITYSISKYYSEKRTFDDKTNTWKRTSESNDAREITTNNVCWFDCAPIVKMNSAKNVVMTKVQGRDYSRKELISGGDLKFTVSGRIVSGYPDVYPYDEVAKFIEIMKYNGVIKIANPLFNQFGVNKIIITDFSCDQELGFADTQPYSFNCVAIEPDEDNQIAKDTIEMIDTSIQSSEQNSWIKTLLKNKTEDLKNGAINSSAKYITNVLKNI